MDFVIDRHPRAGGGPVNLSRKATYSELDARVHGHDDRIEYFPRTAVRD
jgi:hypothetical protein